MGAGGNEVEIVVKTRDQTAQGAKTARESFKSVERESRSMAGGFDRAADGADAAENKAQGLASTLTGTKDTMAGVGMIARGNTFEGFVMLGQGAADLAEGLNYTVIPAAKAAAGAFTRQGLAAVRNTVAAVASRAAMVAGAVATGAMTAAQWALNAAMSANPIALVIIAIVALIAIVVVAYNRSATFRNVVQGAFRAVLAAGRALWSGLQAVFRGIGSLAGWLAGVVVAAARRGFLGPIPWIIANWGRVLAFFRALPGRVAGFLAGLPGRLFSIGTSIVQRLIDGIRSRVGAVGSAIGSVVSKIAGFLPRSPAKEGPLSGQGDPYLAGQKIAGRVAGGIRSGRGGIGSAMGGTLAGGRGAAGAGAGGPLVLRIESGGSRLDDLLVELLRKAIRARGGDVQEALGT